MRAPKSIKKFKPKKRDQRGKHTKAQRIARQLSFKQNLRVMACRGCLKVLDQSIHTEEGDAIVCTDCGLVDNNPCFDFEAPVFDHLPHSPFYKHKNYYAEKILQARNKEPRIRDQELDIMSMVYNIFKDKCTYGWSEGDFTKSHCAKICRLITNIYPKSPFVRRVERWYQYRTYISGSTFGELPEIVACQLRCLFDAYSYFFLLYLKQNNIPKRNITKLDLLNLVLLYNLSKYNLSKFGWYFLNHNIINKTKSVYKDYELIALIFTMINENILLIKPTSNILPQCYTWFRDGNKLVIPPLDELLDSALHSPLSTMQYIAHKRKFNYGKLSYYRKEYDNYSRHAREMLLTSRTSKENS